MTGYWRYLFAFVTVLAFVIVTLATDYYGLAR
jgi:hypothetical protein